MCETLVKYIKQNHTDKELFTVGVSAGGYLSVIVSAICDEVSGAFARSGILDEEQIITYSGPNQPIPKDFNKYFNSFDLLLMSYPKPIFVITGSNGFIDGDDYLYNNMNIDLCNIKLEKVFKNNSLVSNIFLQRKGYGHQLDINDLIIKSLK